MTRVRGAADLMLDQLYQQILNGVVPDDTAAVAGSLAAMIQYIANGSVAGYQATALIPDRTRLPEEQIILQETYGWTVGTAWPANNQAIYIPFAIPQNRTIAKIHVVVAIQSGNVDVGIYPRTGGAKLVTMGSTAVGAAGIQTLDIADTVLPGGKYLAAMSCSTTAATFRGIFLTNTVGIPIALGYKQEASALALPASATPVAPAQPWVPLMVLEWV